MQKQKNNIQKKSISKILREENKSNDIFEIMLLRLSLEELISLKLELVAKSVGNVVYGVPLWKSLDYIVKDAILRYAASNNSSKNKASRYLGIDIKSFRKLIKQYKLESFYKEEKKDE